MEAGLLLRVKILRNEGRTWKDIAGIIKQEGFRSDRGTEYTPSTLSRHFKTAIQAERSEQEAYNNDPSRFPKMELANNSEQGESSERSGRDVHSERNSLSSEQEEYADRAEAAEHSDRSCEQPSEQDENSEDKPAEPEESPGHSMEHSLHSENMTPEMTKAVQEIAREVCEDIIRNMQSIPTNFDDDDLPPPPETLKGSRGRKENRQYKKVTVTIDKELWKLFDREAKKRKISSGRLIDIILWRYYGKPPLSYEPKTQKNEQTT